MQYWIQLLEPASDWGVLMFYAIMKIVCRFLFGVIFRTKVMGIENVPKEGAIIVAANHLSNWDPPLLGTFISREICYMAKEELFKNPIFAAAIRALHVFPVKRGTADKTAIKHAVKLLKNGHCLGIFPEGTRSKTGELGKAEAGVGLITAMTNAPVIPVAIINTNKIFGDKMFPQLGLVYGKPMYFNGNIKDKEALAEFSQSIMTKIKALQDSYRANM